MLTVTTVAEARKIIECMEYSTGDFDLKKDTGYVLKSAGETMRSAQRDSGVLKGHCMDGSLMAGALFEQLRYRPGAFPPLILSMILREKSGSRDICSHAVSAYRETGIPLAGGLGAIGTSRYMDTRGRPAVFRNIPEMLDSYRVALLGHGFKITGYKISDLRRLTNVDWRDSSDNLEFLSEMLMDSKFHINPNHV